MKFIIRRTSGRGNSSPCAGSKKEQVVKIETRTLHSPEEFDKKFADREGNWLSVGTNHRIGKNGYICRDREMMNVCFIFVSGNNAAGCKLLVTVILYEPDRREKRKVSF